MCNSSTLAYEVNISYEKTKLNLMNTVNGCNTALNLSPATDCGFFQNIDLSNKMYHGY